MSNAERSSPREYQLNQIRRRFSPSEKEDERKNTVLTLKLKPSDPDFPFELDALLCTLVVPASYPDSGRPSLRISNPEMDRGYQINVERGFDSLVSRTPQKTLLAWMNDLDRSLESFLTPEKAQTIKLIANAGPAASVSGALPQAVGDPELPGEVSKARQIQKETAISPKPPAFTAQERADAEARHTADLRQLEARMGRQPLYSKSPDGVTFTVPIQPKARNLLPLSLQSIQSVKLIVPMSYNLDPCRILIAEAGPEARLIEEAFKKRAQQHPEMSLMMHLNLLGVNMHLMANEDASTKAEVAPVVSTPLPTAQNATPTPTNQEEPSSISTTSLADQDKSHIHVIPRPPEWSHVEEESDGEDTYSDNYDSKDDVTPSDEEGGVHVEAEASNTTQPERGILLSLPFLELYGLELFELTSMSLTIKCDRCKDTKDVKGIRSQTTEQPNNKTESCNKCGNVMTIGKTNVYVLHGHQLTLCRLPKGTHAYEFNQSRLPRSRRMHYSRFVTEVCNIVDEGHPSQLLLKQLFYPYVF